MNSYDIGIVLCLVVIAICLGLIADFLPKHISWIRSENNRLRTSANAHPEMEPK